MRGETKSLRIGASSKSIHKSASVSAQEQDNQVHMETQGLSRLAVREA